MESINFKHLESLCASEAKIQTTTPAHKIPIVASSAFKFNSIEEGIEIFKNQPGEHVYTRYGNPTIEAVAQKIADLEAFGLDFPAFGLLSSSGMAAINLTIQTLLNPGDRIITQGNLYGGTTELFLKIFGKQQIETIISDFSNLEELQNLKSADPKRKTLIYIETPANPTLQCFNLEAIGKACQNLGYYFVVDNTFATPILQQPLRFQADVVVHSTTKYLHGHGTSTGGAIITRDRNLHKQIWETLKLTGSNSNPFDAWMINLGLKTLSIRMLKQSENALQLATKLEQLPKIKRVFYPGLASNKSHVLALKQMKAYGAIVSFEVGDTLDEAIRFCNALKHCAIAPSLGETDTMILHPATMSHLKIPVDQRLKYDIKDSLIRFSIGLEHVDDILADIEQALIVV